MDFKERLRYYREKAGYKTAKDFSQRVGIPYPTYAAYENAGREPKYSVLIKISQTLGVSTDDLLGNVPDNFAWIKSALENNGFLVIDTGQTIDEWHPDYTKLNQPWKKVSKHKSLSAFIIHNLGDDGYHGESFFVTLEDLEFMLMPYKNSDQRGLHKVYLDLLRRDFLRKIAPVMRLINSNSRFKVLKEFIIKRINPDFFYRWYSDDEDPDEKIEDVFKFVTEGLTK